MSNIMTTYSKIKLDPLNPTIDDISIDDIAHALSLMCRANGHLPEFYSVAQHCIRCCEEAIKRGYNNSVALGCLLHDASEAYLADVIRPIKPSLQNYLAIEENLQEFIYKKYITSPLTEDDRNKIMIIDNLILHHEFKHYMEEEIPFDDIDLFSCPKFEFEDFNTVRDHYKKLFYSLTTSN